MHELFAQMLAVAIGLLARLVVTSSRCYYICSKLFSKYRRLDSFQFYSRSSPRRSPISAISLLRRKRAELGRMRNINYSNDAYRYVATPITIHLLIIITSRSNHISAYEQINFEDCGSDSCTNTLRVNLLGTCRQGSVSRYGVVAQSPSDVMLAVNFLNSII